MMKRTGSKVLCDVKKIYYYCNRSGYFNPRGQQHRSLKSRGTAKIDSYCTAGMVVTIEDRFIEVSVYMHHSLWAPDKFRIIKKMKALKCKTLGGIHYTMH